MNAVHTSWSSITSDNKMALMSTILTSQSSIISDCLMAIIILYSGYYFRYQDDNHKDVHIDSSYYFRYQNGNHMDVHIDSSAECRLCQYSGF